MHHLSPLLAAHPYTLQALYGPPRTINSGPAGPISQTGISYLGSDECVPEVAEWYGVAQ